MWIYEKKLQYPVNIKNPNPKMAQVILSQLGGPDGELSAALRYMNQRYSMPNNEAKGLLTDIATEELGHVEMISAIVYQLTRNLSMEEIKQSGFDKYFVDHTTALYPASPTGVPFTAAYFQSKGDAFADLAEDMAAEQKARATYENILRLADDPDVIDPIRFLREREIVHFQRFGEAMRLTQDQLNSKNFYACNPSFDKNCKCTPGSSHAHFPGMHAR
ncbi:MAG: manganese catalase family protein [Oscillospiraceae bacterium]|nr:manganese catalase family protein [Oscillospiraceae bacterium]